MTVYSVPIPTVSSSITNFVFQATVGSDAILFNFKWYNSVWNLFVTLPSGEIRQAGVYPNIINWTGFADYNVGIGFPNSNSIGMRDLEKVSLYLAVY